MTRNNPTPKDFDAEVDEALEIGNPGKPGDGSIFEALKAERLPEAKAAREAALERRREALTKAAEARMSARAEYRASLERLDATEKVYARLTVARDANVHYSLVSFFPLGGATIALVALLVLGDAAGDWLRGTAFGLSSASALTALGQMLLQKSFTKPYHAAVKNLREKN